MPEVKFFLTGPCGCQASTLLPKPIRSLEAGFLLELRFCHDTDRLLEDCLETFMRTRDWSSHQATWQYSTNFNNWWHLSGLPLWSVRKCKDYQSIIHVVGRKWKQLPTEILAPDRCSSPPVVAQGQSCGVLPLKLSVAFSHWGHAENST